MTQVTKIYENPRAGHNPEYSDYNAWTERIVEHRTPEVGAESLYEILEMRQGNTRITDGKYVGRLVEALVTNPDAANMLRDSLRYISFESYGRTPALYETFTKSMPTNSPSEYYLRDGVFGILEETPSGQEATMITRDIEGGVNIPNKRYSKVVAITGDDIRFDRIGMIGTIASQLGGSAKLTIDAKCFEAMTDTSNYTRTKSAGDNDIGANTQGSGFKVSATNFQTAYNTISTMRDRTSGTPGMCTPDTAFCSPRAEWGLRQLLMGVQNQRVGDASFNETYGTSNLNVHYGMISKIISSPLLGDSYQWGLFDSKKTGLVYQELEAFNVYQQTAMPNNESWFTFDIIKYMVSMYFGIGFVDDRPWFYAASTTAPSVD